MKPGDEVIVPSLTFIAPVNSIAYNNATPVFLDSDNFYNLDSDKVISFIKNETFYKNGFSYNKKTNNKISAILPVHVWGNAVWLDEIIKLCREKNITVVEDASESLGTFYSDGKFKGKHTGTIGKLGCISFNGNKIITSGGGGMILTNFSKLAEKAKYLTTQAKDDPLNYVHDEIGYNFRLTNIQSAVGVAQLEQLPSILKRKKKIYNFYRKKIADITGFSICSPPKYANNNHWLNILKINRKTINKHLGHLIKKFENNGIQARPVWKLNHMQKPYQKFQNYKIENSNNLVLDSLCLPSSPNISKRDLEKIINQLYE